MLNQQKYIVLSGAKEYFISTWKTDNTSAGSSTDHQIKLPLEATGIYNFTVEWGDGKSDKITVWNQSETTHTYSDIGTYEIKIEGTLEGFVFNNSGDKLKLLTVENWGKNFKLGNSNSYFYGCTNFNINADDELNTSQMTDMYRMFYDCTSLNSSIKFNDTSNVTNMTYMFRGCSIFNGSVASLDTKNVTTMAGLFYSCLVFNKSVANFDTSNVENMYAMFYNCPDFNQDVSGFDTAKVTNMSYMFSDCDDFDQDVSGFDTSKVTDMHSMFYGAGSFNPNIGGWDVGLVTDMAYMLYQKTSFNRDLSSWNIVNVTTMEEILTDCTSWSQANYDAALIAWDSLIVKSGVSFKCSSNYTAGGAAAAARADLIATYTWSITDLGGV